jgi:hypothetical protein
MGLRGKVGALARGEVSTAALTFYAAANQDAYDLLDRIAAEGPAAVSAWCAFVLQIHADNLTASGTAPGYCHPDAFADATVLYELAAGWLERAREAQASTEYALDVVVPQPYPQLHGAQNADQLSALRKTVEAVQSRLGAALAARQSRPIEARLRPTLPALQAALDAAEGAGRSTEPTPELRAAITRPLAAALGHAFQAGQLLAMPGLAAKRPPEPPPAPAVSSSTTLAAFMPGDPGFDPWCLTDPVERLSRVEDAASIGMLDELWRADPEPAQTLALQAQIAAALEGGAIDYMPEAPASLQAVAGGCPWPGVLFAKSDLVLGGEQIEAGDQFLLAVGADGETFRRGIERISARAVARQLDEEARAVDADFDRRNRAAAAEQRHGRNRP